MGKTISYGKSIKMREEQPSSIEQIIDRYPSNEFNSITISTIPLLDVFFNHDMVKLLELKEDDAEYIFEYTLSPKKGKGKASCTDLMILGENINYCIEAKRTEGRYETVEKWLQKDNSKGNNRQTVLEGWLEYINQDLTLINILEEIKDIPYQMIHRLASACYVHNKTNTPTELIYLIFESENQSTDKKYKKDLEYRLLGIRKLTENNSY